MTQRGLAIATALVLTMGCSPGEQADTSPAANVAPAAEQLEVTLYLAKMNKTLKIL